MASMVFSLDYVVYLVQAAAQPQYVARPKDQTRCLPLRPKVHLLCIAHVTWMIKPSREHHSQTLHRGRAQQCARPIRRRPQDVAGPRLEAGRRAAADGEGGACAHRGEEVSQQLYQRVVGREGEVEGCTASGERDPRNRHGGRGFGGGRERACGLDCKRCRNCILNSRTRRKRKRKRKHRNA